MEIKITKDMVIGQVIQIEQGFVPILINMGMNCLGCPSSQRESLEEACRVHDIDVEQLLRILNGYLASKNYGK